MNPSFSLPQLWTGQTRPAKTPLFLVPLVLASEWTEKNEDPGNTSQEIHMKQATPVKRLQVSMMVWGIILAHPFSLAAQEAVQKQHAEQPENLNTQEKKRQGRPVDIVTEMRQMRKERKEMRQKMTQALQQQVTALREHTKAMEEISDEKRLLVEMKKHLQMTDAVLGTMVEQRATLDAAQKEHRARTWSHMGKNPQTEKNVPEEYETHPNEKD
jgi:hypothetical protein